MNVNLSIQYQSRQFLKEKFSAPYLFYMLSASHMFCIQMFA